MAGGIDHSTGRAVAGCLGSVLMVAGWLVGVAVLVVMCSSPADARGRFPDRYDDAIRSAAERWLPGWDWRLYKAQLYQESMLDPDARSPVGASGIAQFMPATWREVAPAIGAGNRARTEPRPAIKAGAYYDAKLQRIWTAPRPKADRISLVLASYNAGAGNVLDAQRACGGPNQYACVIRCLPEITGEHAQETRTYVKRTWRWWRAMVIGGG